MPEEILRDFERGLEALIGQPVWGMIPGQGMMVSMELGERVLRVERLRNRLLPEEVRLREGRFSLFVKCPWRLETPERIVCGSGDDLSPDGEPEFSLSVIDGARVTSIRVIPPALDLILEFEGGFVLRTFCEVGHPSSEDNYSVFLHDWIYVAGAASTIRREPRAPNPARHIRAVECSS